MKAFTIFGIVITFALALQTRWEFQQEKERNLTRLVELERKFGLLRDYAVSIDAHTSKAALEAAELLQQIHNKIDQLK
jgi:hypothetical protein